MVWDETVAFLFVLFFTPMTAWWQAFAFVAFRVFDIAKPQPIRYYERVCKGGWGVMIDDIFAAFYTLLVLSVARLVVG
jgi:phosphatidylglycerophosphatase A